MLQGPTILPLEKSCEAALRRALSLSLSRVDILWIHIWWPRQERHRSTAPWPSQVDLGCSQPCWNPRASQEGWWAPNQFSVGAVGRAANSELCVPKISSRVWAERGLFAGSGASMCTPPCLLGPCWVLHCDIPNALLCNLWFGVCVPHYFWKLPSFFLQVQSKCGVAVVITLCSNTWISFGHRGRLGRNWHFFPPSTFYSDSLNITLVFASVCHGPQQNHLAVTSI